MHRFIRDALAALAAPVRNLPRPAPATALGQSPPQPPGTGAQSLPVPAQTQPLAHER